MRSPPQDEISHIFKIVRPLRDDQVDRLEVEVQRCMERTSTNRSRTYPMDIRLYDGMVDDLQIQF